MVSNDSIKDTYPRLLDLPRELRDQVYEYVTKALPPLKPIDFTTCPSPSKLGGEVDINHVVAKVSTGHDNPCSLFFVNKQISEEFLEVFRLHARVYLRLSQKEICSHFHIATSALITRPEALKRHLTNSLLNLISDYRNFVVRIDVKEMGSGINDSSIAPAHKWPWALRSLLSWTYGTQPLTANNAKNVTIMFTKNSLKYPNKLGLNKLPEIVKDFAEDAYAKVKIDANISTADILDNEHRKSTLESFHILNECRHLGIEVKITQR